MHIAFIGLAINAAIVKRRQKMPFSLANRGCFSCEQYFAASWFFAAYRRTQQKLFWAHLFLTFRQHQQGGERPRPTAGPRPPTALQPPRPPMSAPRPPPASMWPPQSQAQLPQKSEAPDKGGCIYAPTLTALQFQSGSTEHKILTHIGHSHSRHISDERRRQIEAALFFPGQASKQEVFQAALRPVDVVCRRR